MRPWELIVPAEDRAIYARGGYGSKTGSRAGLGQRPCLLIVDVTFAFTGTRPLPAAEAVREFTTSCGERAWQAIPHIRRLLQACRRRRIPVVYTTGDRSLTDLAVRTTKVRHLSASRAKPDGFPAPIAPLRGELVVRKAMASAFFGTPLATYLRSRDVDSILLAGVSTSGCVRASAVDAYSSGYPVHVVEECCFDRSEFSHLTNLFDINAKYGSVITLKDALRGLPGPRRARSNARGGKR
jgi:nicotinamidase-related amidase